MQAITCVISQYVENSSIVYVIEILRRCEGRHLLQETQYEKTDYFWFKECPICDGQGRLIIKKILTLINYFSVAMNV